MGKGSIKGLRARGGSEVDISWKDSRLTKAVIHSRSGQPCRVVYGDRTWELETTAGKPYQLEVG